MKTVGPAISLRTSFWLLLQNEHRKTSSLFFFNCAPSLCIQNGGNPRPMRVSRSLGNNFVDDTILLRLVRRHDVVALNVFFDSFQRLPRMMRENFIQNSPNAKNFFCVDIDVGCLTLQAAHPWLVNEHARMRQREAFFRSARRQKDGSHTRRLSNADRCYIVPDELDGVVDSQARGN